MVRWTFALADDAHSPIPDYVPALHRAVIERWLAANHAYRVATDADCKCKDEIAALRAGTRGAWGPQPDFHPYYTSGDFNGDGSEDFAVIFLHTGNAQKSLLAIFNGPFPADRPNRPVYLSRKYALPLFYGPPRPKPYLLVAGKFEAGGVVFLPYKKTYKPR
jgi:hypothetical protein